MRAWGVVWHQGDGRGNEAREPAKNDEVGEESG